MAWSYPRMFWSPLETFTSGSTPLYLVMVNRLVAKKYTRSVVILQRLSNDLGKEYPTEILRRRTKEPSSKKRLGIIAALLPEAVKRGTSVISPGFCQRFNSSFNMA